MLVDKAKLYKVILLDMYNTRVLYTGSFENSHHLLMNIDKPDQYLYLLYGYNYWYLIRSDSIYMIQLYC